MPDRRLWDECQRALKERLNPHNYESWIDPIECLAFTGKEVTLAVPSSFFIEWINEHYRDQIESILTDMTGGPVSIAFLVSKGEVKSPPEPKAKGKAPAPTKEERTLTLAAARERAHLNEKYTFDSFVVGKSNEFCHASAKAVASKLGQTYNPLFLYGGVGLGKTHLMQAIGNAAIEKNPEANVLYISSEKFVNDLITAIQRGSMTAFRKRYRSLDVLLVDDIQFIGGKERTQEEFFHTFNALFDAKKQIVISSDKFPKEITKLEERLRSRFAWGLISDIQPPELEIKIAIVKKIARNNSFVVDDEVATFLAGKIKSNIRELEGVLARVMAYASLTGRSIDVDMAHETLKGIYDDAHRSLDIKQIQKVVCDVFKVKLADMKSKSRKKTITIPRHVAAYLCREYTTASLPEIGRAFGGRDHTTVLHSCEKIKGDMETNTSLYNQITEIKRELDL
ncbi:MAG: chromosomal replication initiator protein DnaA [Nitrospinae bacterium]|nr:chromosomal replication initiator protein DnaA [Nitrospinota bacterium]